MTNAGAQYEGQQAKALAPLRIILLSTSLGFGGAERQVLELAKRLDQRGHDVRIISMVPLGPMGEQARDEGMHVTSLNMPRGVPDLRALSDLVRIVRTWRPDVIHSHMVHANLMARAARLWAAWPVLVCTIHNENEGARWREVAYRVTDRQASLNTHVSLAGLERFVRVQAVPSDRIIYVPNGVDTETFRPDRQARKYQRQMLGLSGRFVWLSVGRLVEAKDHMSMLRAFSLVQEERPDAHLLLVGAGHLEEPLRRLAQELGVKHATQFVGNRSDIPDVMNAADAFVLSSAWEGMPMVLLEAAAVGLPIVSTEVGGTGEVVVNGKSGFLVPAREPRGLAEAMVRLESLPLDMRQAMGAAGRQHVETNFGLESIADLWQDTYRSLLNKARKAA